MKRSFLNTLFKIFFVFVFVFAFGIAGNYAKAGVIEKVSFNCSGDNKLCQQMQRSSMLREGKNIQISNVPNFISSALNHPAVNKINYQVIEDGAKNILNISISMKKPIQEIKFYTIQNKKEVEFEPKANINYEYYEDIDLDYLSDIVVDELQSKGQRVKNIDVDLGGLESNRRIVFKAEIGDTVNFEKLEIVAPDRFVGIVKERFNKFIGKSWNKVDFEISLDSFSRDIFYDGYYFSELKYEAEKTQSQNLKITIRLNLGDRFNISTSGNTIFTRNELLFFIRNYIKNKSGQFDSDQIKNEILDRYKERGYYGTSIKVRKIPGLDKDKNKIVVNYFEIIEGKKVRVIEHQFLGNTYYKYDKIFEQLSKLNSTLIASGYFDQVSYGKVPAVIKNLYLSNGFFDIDVRGPYTEFVSNEKVKVLFKIHEGKQYIINSINISGLVETSMVSVKAKMKNTFGGPLNVVELDNDLKKILDDLGQQGYVFAKIRGSDGGILSIDDTTSAAHININIDQGRRVLFEDLKIVGNSKTDLDVIEREIVFKVGEPVTPTKIKEITDKLLSLGLFSSVRASPIITRDLNETDSYSTLIVNLKEKDYGLIKAALGFRTDLGLKASSNLNLENLGGRNKTVNINMQVNRRFDLSALDAKRRTDNTNFIEGATNVSYSQPNLFNSQIKFDAISAASRTRFYGFDADIFQNSLTFSRNFKKNLGLGLMYQHELIQQYNATREIDSGYFRIGSLTPSVTLDFRDDPIIPRKGFLTGLSYEIAHPNLNSLNSDQIEINYNKLVWRNKVYWPITEDITFATSLSAGMQENKAKELLYDSNGSVLLNQNGRPRTRGYIPSIKVFRLDGFDNVRGFADPEINRLISGLDISETVIQNKAYFVNLKLEPRLFIDDSLIMGLFLDTGRVFVDSLKINEIRSSAGLSFKLVTPVGTLDFNYGVKLKREYDASGNKESFGRFHISIGFF